jgi:hypothetical protein
MGRSRRFDQALASSVPSTVLSASTMERALHDSASPQYPSGWGFRQGHRSIGLWFILRFCKHVGLLRQSHVTSCDIQQSLPFLRRSEPLCQVSDATSLRAILFS